MARTEQDLKRTVRDLVAGREVPPLDAHAVARWLRGDFAVVETAAGGVRLRVPALPKATKDVRGGGRS